MLASISPDEVRDRDKSCPTCFFDSFSFIGCPGLLIMLPTIFRNSKLGLKLIYNPKTCPYCCLLLLWPWNHPELRFNLFYYYMRVKTVLNHAQNFLEVLLQGTALVKMPTLSGLDACSTQNITYLRKNEFLLLSFQDNTPQHAHIWIKY